MSDQCLISDHVREMPERRLDCGVSPPRTQYFGALYRRVRFMASDYNLPQYLASDITLARERGRRSCMWCGFYARLKCEGCKLKRTRHGSRSSPRLESMQATKVHQSFLRHPLSGNRRPCYTRDRAVSHIRGEPNGRAPLGCLCPDHHHATLISLHCCASVDCKCPCKPVVQFSTDRQRSA